MNRKLTTTLVCVLIVAAFVAGYKLRPRLSAEALLTVYTKYIGGHPPHKQAMKDGVVDTVMATDNRHLIHIASAQEAADKRAAMIRYIFRGEPAGMARLPDKVEHDVTFPPLLDLSLAALDELTVTLPFGVDSRVFYLKAAKPAGCLMIYQEGHQVSFLERKTLLDMVTRDGCDMLALSLPLTGGLNSRPEINHPQLGHMILDDPDDLELLDAKEYSSLAYFFTPLVAALNHATKERDYSRIGAIGFSGGGWAVQILAAMDPRIQATYSVAGSSPTDVHAAMPEWGSPEQRQGRFYQIANYPEIYVMDADRPGRRHLQFFNETDPCCFAGSMWSSWKDAVGERINALGGEYGVLTYRDPQHTLTDAVATAIIDDFLHGNQQPLPDGVTRR